jgi:hypothetical protein
MHLSNEFCSPESKRINSAYTHLRNEFCSPESKRINSAYKKRGQLILVTRIRLKHSRKVCMQN